MKLPDKSQMWGPSGPLQESEVSKVIKDKNGAIGIRTVLDPDDLEVMYLCLCEIWRSNPYFTLSLSSTKEKLEQVFELSWKIHGRDPKFFRLRNGMLVRELVAPRSGSHTAYIYLILNNASHEVLLEHDCMVLIPGEKEGELPVGGPTAGREFDAVEEVQHGL